MPLCFGASGSVRARQMPHCARCARDVHTFCPVSFQPPFGANGFRAQRREVGARAGLAEQLAPDQLAAQRGGHEPLDLLGAAVLEDRRRRPPADHQIRAAPRRPRPAPGRSAAARPGPASRPYGRGQCGASSPASASATCCFSAGSAATSATAEAISGCRCRHRARDRCADRGARRRRVSAATRRSQRGRPPRNCAIPYARRRYRWASCSHVMPMPPSTWMQSLALAFAASMRGRRRDRGGDRELAFIGIGHGGGGVTGGHRDLLGAQQHLGAHVLDRLEAADRLAELLAHLRVLGGGLQCPAGQPRGLGGQHRRGQVLDPLRRDGQHLGGRGVEHAPAPAGGRSRWPSAVRRSRRRPWRRPAASCRRRAAAAPRAASAPSTYSARAGRPAAVVPQVGRSAATPAVRSPDASASSSSACDHRRPAWPAPWWRPDRAPAPRRPRRPSRTGRRRCRRRRRAPREARRRRSPVRPGPA